MDNNMEQLAAAAQLCASLISRIKMRSISCDEACDQWKGFVDLHSTSPTRQSMAAMNIMERKHLEETLSCLSRILIDVQQMTGSTCGSPGSPTAAVGPSFAGSATAHDSSTPKFHSSRFGELRGLRRQEHHPAMDVPHGVQEAAPALGHLPPPMVPAHLDGGVSGVRVSSLEGGLDPLDCHGFALE